MRKFSSANMFKKKPSVAAVERQTTQSSTSTDPDVEKVADGQIEGLKRDMSPRNLNTIAFSGSVGTGLIIGTGKRYVNAPSYNKFSLTELIVYIMASELTQYQPSNSPNIYLGGPGSLMTCFLLIGFVVWSVITALGEMAAMCPMKKGFAGYATRFVDPCLGFATVWNYFLKYVILLPTNLTASGMIIQYWKPDLNVAIFVTVFGLGLVALNLFHVSTYGGAQYYLVSLNRESTFHPSA